MPIVFIHGVAVRDDDPTLAKRAKQFGDVGWPAVQAYLAEHVAPAVSADPEGVPVMRIYWGDLAGVYAWGGRSLVSSAAREAAEAPSELDDIEAGSPRRARARSGEWFAGELREQRIRGLTAAATALRKPYEQFLPSFMGDVLTYVATRGDAGRPGPIVQRVLDGLETAAFAAHSRREPLVVLTHSMGGQIVYDLVTHFLPRMPRYREIRLDYWCAAASQVGWFEELGLFLESDPRRGDLGDHDSSGRMTPLPPTEHLGGWWNVWNHADFLSFRADGIFDGVDDTPFFAAGRLTTDHYKYLDNAEFYTLLAERVRKHRAEGGRRDVERPGPRSTQE